MSEVIKSDAPTVEGEVLEPSEVFTLSVSDQTVSDFDAMNPQALRDAVAAGESGIADFNARLRGVYRGAGAAILNLTHARTMASAYAVRVADEQAKLASKDPAAKASAVQVNVELKQLDPDFKEVSDGRITQYRNAASALIDLELPTSDPRVGPLLNLSAISAPLKSALAKREAEGADAGRSEFFTLAGEALAKQVETKRAARAKAVTAATTGDTPSGQATTSTPERTPAVAAESGKTSAADALMVSVASFKITSAEDYAALAGVMHAIAVRLNEVPATIATKGKALAKKEADEAEAAAKSIAEARKARKATPATVRKQS